MFRINAGESTFCEVCPPSISTCCWTQLWSALLTYSSYEIWVRAWRLQFLYLGSKSSSNHWISVKIYWQCFAVIYGFLQLIYDSLSKKRPELHIRVKVCWGVCVLKRERGWGKWEIKKKRGKTKQKTALYTLQKEVCIWAGGIPWHGDPDVNNKNKSSPQNFDRFIPRKGDKYQQWAVQVWWIYK